MADGQAEPGDHRAQGRRALSPSLLEDLRSRPELISEVTQATDSEFHLQQRLRRRFPAELVRAALQLRDLRVRAREKFSRADQMWFDRAGLEQATAEIVAHHKAGRFIASKGSSEVYDLCCGIGSDAIAVALTGLPVVAIDRSPQALHYTTWNAEAYGAADRIQVRQRDVTELTDFSSLVHIDPDRRTGRQRAVRLEDYCPPLEYLQRLTTSAPGGAIKLSPASNFGGKFPGCEIELISLGGECKEATAWFGDLAGDNEWRATVLPSGDSVTGDPWAARSEVSSLGEFLYDPDPAVVRAGLVDVLAETAGFVRLDPSEEYLTSQELVKSPFVQAFEVVDELHFSERDLKAYFRTLDCGELEIKCRHVPVSAERLRQKLKPSGTGRISLIVARIEGRVRAVIARRR